MGFGFNEQPLSGNLKIRHKNYLYTPFKVLVLNNWNPNFTKISVLQIKTG